MKKSNRLSTKFLDMKKPKQINKIKLLKARYKRESIVF